VCSEKYGRQWKLYQAGCCHPLGCPGPLHPWWYKETFSRKVDTAGLVRSVSHWRNNRFAERNTCQSAILPVTNILLNHSVLSTGFFLGSIPSIYHISFHKINIIKTLDRIVSILKTRKQKCLNAS
jgi:hypothetical protein